MGRRKPAHVQRKRPREIDLRDDTDEEEKEDASDGSGARSVASGRASSSESTTSRPKKKERMTYSDPILRVWERILPAEASRCALTFRDAWTSVNKRRDALWVNVRIVPQLQPALVHALVEFEETLKRMDPMASDPDAVFGVELDGPNRAITVCAKGLTASDGDDATVVDPMGVARMATDMTLGNLFPGTYDTWTANLVNLVVNELLVVEIVRLDGLVEADSSFVWRFGIAWRPYMALLDNEDHVPVVPGRGASYHRSVHHVMIWLLKNSRTIEGQCEYPYWKELDVLYDQFVGISGTQEESEASSLLQTVPFDIHDIYARIDTHQQLQRDVSNFEEARANGGGASLLPTLRPYQKAAVSWMLSRENPKTHPRKKALAEFPAHVAQDEGEGLTLVYDPFCGIFRNSSMYREGELLQPPHFDLSSVRGGILADEMGLGKTVEVITLVLCNPCPAKYPTLQSSHVVQSDAENERDDETPLCDCICGSPDDHELGWVQCTFCNTWHHQVCTGYNETNGRTHFIHDGALGGANEYAPESFMCFHCQVTENPQFVCKTTLIVSPESIHDQWEMELKRHVKPGTLKLLRYPGVKALRSRFGSSRGPSAEWSILANAGLDLASYDVVLTTYEALSSDLYHLPTELTQARRSSTRQKRKRYAFVASPLVFLKFWRVCMDEAQVGVENAQLQAALTVAKLNAEMKWVVTGTPFSTQVGDLYGCFKFLRLAPYDDERTGATLFREVIEKCFSKGAMDRVLDILLWDGSDSSSSCARDGGGLLWRTSKKDVLAQLNLPSQETELIWCRFSEVERHFYDEQEKSIIAMVSEHQRQSSRTDRNPASRTADVTEKVWNDLLILRQICCHPQVGSTLNAMFSFRGRAASGEMNGGVMSMDEFLQQLIVKCKRECEEGQRKFLAAQNGLASLHVIKAEMPVAILKYLSCIQVIKSNWDMFRADLLPRLHILENLTRCVRSAFEIERDGVDSNAGFYTSTVTSSKLVRQDLTRLENEMADISNNPKEHSLLPDLPAVTRAISADAGSGISAIALADKAAIAQECDTLDICANKIKKFYLYQVESSHMAALQSFEGLVEEVDRDIPPVQARSAEKRQALCSRSLWWLEALATLEAIAPEQALLFADRLRARLLSFGTNWASRFCRQFTTLSGFRVVFLNELEELHKKRTLLYEKLEKMSKNPPTKKDIELSGNCKRCRDARDGPVCEHCRLYKELEAFKQHFLGINNDEAARANDMKADIYDDDESVASASSSSITASSLLLEIFKEIGSSTRAAQRAASGASTYDGGLREELVFWTQIQKEWTAAKKLFQVQHQRLGALDELEMATMQIRLRLPDESVVTAAEKLYKLAEYEVPVKFASLESDRIVGEMEMLEKQARLRYLMQLEKQQRRRRSNDSQELPSSGGRVPDRDGEASTKRSPCVICLEEMEDERVMLPCAHTFCKNCMKTLSSQHSATATIKCPTCRRVCSASKVVVVFEDEREATNSKVKARPLRPMADTHINLRRGGYGSKIDAILRRVLALAQRNAEVKCLLFTQWQDMMDIVASHLKQNGVMCFTYTTKKQFHRVMQQFKVYPEPCVLALPFKVGANGLNLVEATEVLLVEPLLNTSIEAQAINRVHRIGQTKQTRVHRLVVDNSVEERIYWLGQKKSRGASATKRSRRGSNSSDQDDGAEDDVLERAPSKKEKEQLTFSDLNVLLDGRMGGAIVSNGGLGAQVHPFWSEQVVLNGKPMARQEAKLFVERLHAADCRARDQNVEDQPRTHLFGQEVNLVVANDVVHLTHPEPPLVVEEQSQSAVSPELLAFHRARVSEELEIWSSAA